MGDNNSPAQLLAYLTHLSAKPRLVQRNVIFQLIHWGLFAPFLRMEKRSEAQKPNIFPYAGYRLGTGQDSRYYILAGSM